MVFLQDSRAEMRRHGIVRGKKIYCIKCGRFCKDWSEFYKHLDTEHRWD